MVGSSRLAADCRVDARVFACFDKRRSSKSQPAACVSLPHPPPAVKVLKIFCQTHSFDNNPAESRSSPKVHAAPGVAANPSLPLLPPPTLPANWTDKKNLFSLFNNLLASRSLPALLICADHVSHLQKPALVESCERWIFLMRSAGDFLRELCLSGAFPKVTLTPCDVI